MAGCADSESTPASQCLHGGGDCLGHAPGAEPPNSRAAAAEGGAGRARVSATEPQVAAGAGLGRSSEGECCPRDSPQSPGLRRPPSAPRCSAVLVATRGKSAAGLGGWRTLSGGLLGGRLGLSPVIIRGPRREIGTPLLVRDLLA